jgi:hypothetical protein
MGLSSSSGHSLRRHPSMGSLASGNMGVVCAGGSNHIMLSVNALLLITFCTNAARGLLCIIKPVSVYWAIGPYVVSARTVGITHL